MSDTEKPVETELPKTEEGTGIYLRGDFPFNHRLRAEAIAKARRKTDPDGVLSDEVIADAAARIAAEKNDPPADAPEQTHSDNADKTAQ